MLNFNLPENRNELISSLIEYHKNNLKPRYENLMNYYMGEHKVTTRMQQDNKPNNKVVNSYPAFIVNTVQGYMLGQPVKYTSESKELLKDIQSIFYKNEEEDHNVEIEKTLSIMGEAFELVYLDEEAQVCFAQLPNAQTLAVYDDSINPKLQLVLRYYEIGGFKNNSKKTIKVELYWPDCIEYYSQVSNKKYTLDDTVEHFFKQVPVVHYLNNKETTGDFEKIISLIDDYDKVLSDNSNELEYFRNAYMVIKGFGGDIDDETLKRFRQTGAFLLPGNSPDEDISFITKDLDDSAIQGHLTTIEKNIHKFSNIPNLTDESFASNLSGVAIRYKLWGFEQLISAKERKFMKGLFDRLRLITTALNLKGKNYSWEELSVKFTRNLPANLLEQSQMMANLKDYMDLIPLEELFSQLAFIENPQEAAEKAKEILKEKEIKAEAELIREIRTNE